MSDDGLNILCKSPGSPKLPPFLLFLPFLLFFLPPPEVIGATLVYIGAGTALVSIGACAGTSLALGTASKTEDDVNEDIGVEDGDGDVNSGGTCAY